MKNLTVFSQYSIGALVLINLYRKLIEAISLKGSIYKVSTPTKCLVLGEVPRKQTKL